MQTRIAAQVSLLQQKIEGIDSMKAYKKLMGYLAKFEAAVMSIILSAVTVITFANVVVRKLTDGQFAWSEELSINLFVLLIMMGCGLCARKCPAKAITGEKKKAHVIDPNTCIRCGQCITGCKFGAINVD